MRSVKKFKKLGKVNSVFPKYSIGKLFSYFIILQLTALIFNVEDQHVKVHDCAGDGTLCQCCKDAL